jgi:Domain of unknown function (DUF4160)/Protein of unknown function (DUF2442)
MTAMDKLVHVTDVEVIDEHQLRLTFEDGIVGDISFEDREWRGVFEPLRDPRRFERVCVDPSCGTIVWPEDGLDMAPEPLYEEALAHRVASTPADEATRSRRRRPILRLSAPDPRTGKFTTTAYPYPCPALYQRSDQGGVPKVSSFYGIAITMHWQEGGHNRPHFHACYGEHEASLDLAGQLIAGSLPTRALRLVRSWARLHHDELDANWQRVVNKELPVSIAPLP